MPQVPFSYQRPQPVLPLLQAEGELSVLNTAKTITVANEAGLVFGVIAVATSVSTTLQYVTTGFSEDFMLAVGLLYTGDSGAFTITADENGTFSSPIALTTGTQILVPVPPDSFSNPFTVTIRALAANSGVAKTGTIQIVDRFDFADSGAPTRVLKTLTLSKTYTP